MGTDIPLWIGGLQKWVTGVTKQTTCEDVIKAVLASNERKGKSQRDPKYYAIIERWHKVERPLDPRSKLLKAWNTWGVEQCNVRFLLKRAHHAQTSTPRDVKSHRRKVSTKSSKTWHPRKLRSESEEDGGCCLEDDEQFPATEEQLKNLIASQGEAISSQLKRLREKDEEIELIENEIHNQRIHQIGANYVLDTYLAESSEGDSNNDDKINNSCDILDTCIELYEKVLQICDQVQKEEQAIKELTAKIKQSVAHSPSIVDENPELAFAGPERLEEILNRTKHDIERLLKINKTQEMTIQQNEQTLSDCTNILEEKHLYLQRLKSELERLDRDTIKLQEEFAAIQVIPVDRTAPSTCTIPENGDSNSDTGLSSLHSSSDDGANVLDTLV